MMRERQLGENAGEQRESDRKKHNHGNRPSLGFAVSSHPFDCLTLPRAVIVVNRRWSTFFCDLLASHFFQIFCCQQPIPADFDANIAFAADLADSPVCQFQFLCGLLRAVKFLCCAHDPTILHAVTLCKCVFSAPPNGWPRAENFSGKYFQNLSFVVLTTNRRCL